jgi:hypothetical protein
MLTAHLYLLPRLRTVELYLHSTIRLQGIEITLPLLQFLPHRKQSPLQKMDNVGFEVLTAVVMKSSIFCDITPCCPLKANRRFEGACCLHLQGPRDKPSTKLAWKQVARRALLKKIVTAYCATHTEKFLMLKQVVHTVTTVLSRVTCLHA